MISKQAILAIIQSSFRYKVYIEMVTLYNKVNLLTNINKD